MQRIMPVSLWQTKKTFPNEPASRNFRTSKFSSFPLKKRVRLVRAEGDVYSALYYIFFGRSALGMTGGKSS